MTQKRIKKQIYHGKEIKKAKELIEEAERRPMSEDWQYDKGYYEGLKAMYECFCEIKRSKE